MINKGSLLDFHLPDVCWENEYLIPVPKHIVEGNRKLIRLFVPTKAEEYQPGDLQEQEIQAVSVELTSGMV
ncbi:hypothetical protein [Waltera sp.]|uniref:hypothetical protein n=1 Tax=Waltera sp. TaxID=2815806 RepID=UPI003A3C9A45